MRLVLLALLLLGSVAVAKPTPFNVTAAFTAEKDTVRWPRGTAETYVIDVVIADTKDRASRNLTVTSTGKVTIDGVEVKVPISAFLSAVRSFGLIVDALVGAVVKTGKLRP